MYITCMDTYSAIVIVIEPPERHNWFLILQSKGHFNASVTVTQWYNIIFMCNNWFYKLLSWTLQTGGSHKADVRAPEVAVSTNDTARRKFSGGFGPGNWRRVRGKHNRRQHHGEDTPTNLFGL